MNQKQLHLLGALLLYRVSLIIVIFGISYHYHHHYYTGNIYKHTKDFHFYAPARASEPQSPVEKVVNCLAMN